MRFFVTFSLQEQPKNQDQEQQPDVKGGFSFGSVLINIGKCLLLIIIIPPFLNYASLQREGQMLAPKGFHISVYRKFYFMQNSFSYIIFLKLRLHSEAISWPIYEVLNAECEWVSLLFFSCLHPDGQIIDVGLGQKMHLLCKGQGKPVGNKMHFLWICDEYSSAIIHGLHFLSIILLPFWSFSHIGCANWDILRYLVLCPGECCSANKGGKLT